MATIQPTSAAIKALKSNLRAALPFTSSSHLSEAIAQALGVNTNAALKAVIAKGQPTPANFNQAAFIERLQELGYTRELAQLSQPVQLSKKLLTLSSTRERAWRNLMVYAINEALVQGLVSLTPEEHFPRPRPSIEKWEHFFNFTLPSGKPCCGMVRDGGFNEVRVRASVNPMVALFKQGFDSFKAGDAHVGGWLERQFNPWLQTSETPELRCKPHLLDELAALPAVPFGFADRGRFML